MFGDEEKNERKLKTIINPSFVSSQKITCVFLVSKLKTIRNLVINSCETIDGKC